MLLVTVGAGGPGVELGCRNEMPKRPGLCQMLSGVPTGGGSGVTPGTSAVALTGHRISRPGQQQQGSDRLVLAAAYDRAVDRAGSGGACTQEHVGELAVVVA